MKTISAACMVAAVVAVVILETGATGVVSAQGRGAKPATAAAGTVEKIVVHGKSLEGNLEGDSPDREATVYLPPAYAGDQSRRFPVIYLLHGYGGREDTFTERLASLQQSSDTLAAAQGFSSAIVVTPSAYTLHKGSMYSNSPTTGDWERFIAEDLVAYMDSHYRTLANRMSRGLAGHSMGGYGALRIGMKRPDVFFSLYLMSSCCLTANRNPQSGVDGGIRSDQDARAGGRGGKRPRLRSVGEPGVGRCVVPEPEEPATLPRPSSQGRQGSPRHRREVGGQRADRDARAHAANLRKYYAIAIEIGTSDGLLASNKQLHETMTRLQIPHHYEEYDGDHTNKVRERIERNVLPFFSKNLAAPANPTSPSPQSNH